VQTTVDICKGCGRKKIIVNRTHLLCSACNQERKHNHMVFLGTAQDELPAKVTVAPTGSTSAFISHKTGQKQDADVLRDRFYLEVWKNNPHVCFECGQALPFYSRVFAHHIIEKSQQKHYSVTLDDPKNGILLDLQCHDQCRLNIDKLPKVKQKTIELLEIFEPFKTHKP
jgi:hypothetical protein